MKKLSINKKVVCVYDSIDEMPIMNFQKYNKYLLIDSGIGSDSDDIDAHIIRIAKLIKAGSNEKALQELQNMRQNLHMVNSEISPRYLAFAALIHSIDGKKQDDLSDDNLKDILADIKTIRHSTIVDFLQWVKKKIALELETYFPDNFIGPKEKEMYDMLRSRTLLVLNSISKDSNNGEEIEAIDAAIFSRYKPKNYAGCDSVEVKYDKQFENVCLLISQKVNVDAKKMTVLQFYNAIDRIKQQIEAEAKSLKPNSRRR